MKYIPGDIYTNVIISSSAEAVSYLISGIIATKYGTKNTFFTCFFCAGIFGISLSFINPNNTEYIIGCLLLSKFGVAYALNLCYLVTSDYFPTNISSTILGACCFCERFTSIMAPIIAEME